MTYTTALHRLPAPLVTPLTTLLNQSFCVDSSFLHITGEFSTCIFNTLDKKARNLLDVSFVQRIGQIREDIALV